MGNTLSTQVDETPRKKSILIWIFGTCFLIWLMIMLGGATRLTHSGLSIVEWKPIVGIIPPLSEAAWLEEFEKYKQFPEFKLVNFEMDLSGFKFIFLMEYAHRVLGRLIGLFFALPLLYFWVRGSLTTSLKKGMLVVLLLGMAQGFMGWYMVKSGLSKDPAVSHYRLTAHLLLALILLGALFWMGLSYQSPIPQKNSPKSKSGLLHMAATSLLLTIIYGGFVAGLKAGKIYNTYPLMEGRFIPAEWDFLSPVYLNFMENPATIQWTHRTLAIITLVLTIYTMIKTRRLPHSSSETKKACHLMMIMITSQVLLGILTLLYEVPVTLGTLHQGLGALVFTMMIYVMFLAKQDRYKEQGSK